MAKLIATLLMAGVPAWALSLEGVAIARLPAGLKFDGLEVGGLSALAYHDGDVTLLSDDRGRHGPSRFYRAKLTIAGKKADLKISGWHGLSGVPGVDEGARVLDPEGLVRLPSGDLLVTSEADTNRKPRETNRLLKLSAKGEFVEEFDFPRDVQPNATGLQTRGTRNNAGPEGLSLCSNGDLWTAMERPLISSPDESRDVRLDRWTLKNGKATPTFSHVYRMDPKDATAKEIQRGISEILCLPDGRLLVIERAVNLTEKLIGTSVFLFVAECAAKECAKTPLMNVGRDLAKLRGNVPVPNFEGLAHGPTLADGRRSILLLSDNNFKADDTELIVLAVKEKP